MPELHCLTGNIDEDKEWEIAVWYLFPGATGPIYFFDYKGDYWHLAGEELVNFRHHESELPRYNTVMKAIEISGQSWGSGCIANSQSTIQIAGDSCVTILDYLKEERSCCLTGTSVARTITATDCLVNDSTIIVTTHYRLYYLDDASKYNNKTIFEGEVDIPYLWNRQNCQYTLIAPPELKGHENPFAPCEHYFDEYFSLKIQQIKKNGPRWKRATLGNVE